MICRVALFMLLIGSAANFSSPGLAQSETQPLDSATIDRVLTRAQAAAHPSQGSRFVAVTESGTVTIMGIPNNFTVVSDLHNGYYRAQVQIGPASFAMGYDGSVWTLRNGALSIVSLPSMVADENTNQFVANGTIFRPDMRSTVTSGRSDTVDGRPVYVLHVEPPGGSPSDLYFDAKTYWQVKEVDQTASGALTTTASDFQTIQGVPTPMRSVMVNSSGTTITMALTSVRFDTALDPAALARPPYVSRGELTAPVSISFVSDRDGSFGHVVVPVTVDGKPTSLFFDSGGGNVLLPQAVQRLGLKAGGGMAAGGVGAMQQRAAFTAVKTVDFGGARLTNQDFIVTSLPYAFRHPRLGVASDGLIGFEYLANFRVSVRYADGRIDLAPFDTPAPTGGITLPFKTDGQHAYVEATIDGVPGYFLLDTGNPGGLLLNEPFVESHHLFTAGGLPYLVIGGFGGGVNGIVATAKSFELAGVTMNGVPVGIPHAESGAFAIRGVAGNLGADILARFTVVFDFKAQTVTFIPNRNLRAAFHSDRTGMLLSRVGPLAMVVGRVFAGTPAAEAGVVAGDGIIAFAGKRVADGYGLGDLSPYMSGSTPFSLTFVHAGVSHTVTITPRSLLPAPQ